MPKATKQETRGSKPELPPRGKIRELAEVAPDFATFLRLVKGYGDLTWEELGELIGIGNIGHYGQGRRQNPTMDSLRKFAEGFGLGLDELMTLFLGA